MLQLNCCGFNGGSDYAGSFFSSSNLTFQPWPITCCSLNSGGGYIDPPSCLDGPVSATTSYATQVMIYMNTICFNFELYLLYLTVRIKYCPFFISSMHNPKKLGSWQYSHLLRLNSKHAFLLVKWDSFPGLAQQKCPPSKNFQVHDILLFINSLQA